MNFYKISVEKNWKKIFCFRDTSNYVHDEPAKSYGLDKHLLLQRSGRDDAPRRFRLEEKMERNGDEAVSFLLTQATSGGRRRQLDPGETRVDLIQTLAIHWQMESRGTQKERYSRSRFLKWAKIWRLLGFFKKLLYQRIKEFSMYRPILPLIQYHFHLNYVQ